MRVVIKNGELEIAISKENAREEKGALLKQYRKAVLDYQQARDLIETLVPIPANLQIKEEMPLFPIDDDMMAKFHYAHTTIDAALQKRQELHDLILKLPKER